MNITKLFTKFNLSFLLLIILCPSIAKAVTFSGTVRLPAGVTAPPGGLEIEVSTFPIEFNFNGSTFSSSSDSIVIPAGQSSQTYSFQVSNGFSSGGVRVAFECETTSCGGLDITSDGFIDSSGAVTSLILAERFNTNRSNSININLEDATVFAGSILFPKNLSAIGDEFFSVRVSNTNQFSFESYSTLSLALSGQKSIPFSIGVPIQNTRGWDIKISCIDCREPLVLQDLYPTTAAGDPLSTSESAAFIYSSGINRRNLRFTLLAEEQEQEGGDAIISPILLLLDE